MLSLQRSQDEFRLIRVLLVPLGVNSLFEEQFLRLSKLQEVSLFDLNRPSSNDKNRHVHFKYMNWNNGKLLVEYLRYDHASSGATEFEDFMASKRIFMVIGLLNHEEYKSASDSTVDGELDRFAKRYPSVLLKKIFVFNFNFDINSPLDATLTRRVQSKQAGNRPSDDILSIFPPDAPCEGGSMVDVHFKQVMSQLLSALFIKLEHMMNICEDARLRNILPQTPTLITVHDDLRDDNASAHALTGSNKGQAPLNRNSTSINVGGTSTTIRVNQQLFRKKPLGRLHKWMGDLSLLVCSPLDAIEHYVLSIAESRHLGDSLWLAGALEGYSAAVLLLHDLGGFDLEECIGKDLKTVKQPPPMDPFDDDDDYDEESDEEGEAGRSEARPAVAKKKKEVAAVFLLAEDRAIEALTVYSSTSFFHLLEVECCFRLAKLLVRVNNYPNRQFKALQLVLRAVTVPGLNSRQQLEAVLQSVLILRALGGLERKMALLMYIGGLMAAEQGSFVVASRLMEDVSRHFGWTRHNSTDGSISSSREWSSLASTVLTDIICIVDEKNQELARQPSPIAAQQQTSVTTYLTHLLCFYGEREEEHAVAKATLARYNRRLLGLDKLPRVRPPQPPAASQQQQLQHQQSSRNNIGGTVMITPVKGLNEETLRKLDNNNNNNLLPPAVPSPAIAASSGRRLPSTSDPSIAALQLQARQSLRPQISPNPLARSASNRPPVEDHHSSMHSIADRLVTAAGGGHTSLRALSVPHHAQLGGGGGVVTAVTKAGPSVATSNRTSSTINQLGDRLKRSLATAANALDDINLFDDNSGSNSNVPAAAAESAILLTTSQRETVQQLQQPLYRGVELAVAKDILQFVTKQLAAQVIPVEMQEAALTMLLSNSSPSSSMTSMMNGWQRKVFSNHLQRLPVLVLGCQPLQCSAEALPATFNAKHVANELQTVATALTTLTSDTADSADPHQPKAPPALFYDPFTARRGREKHRAMQLAEPAKWPLQQMQHLIVKLYNPLAVSLPLTLCPVLSGVPHTAHEVEIELAAYAESFVELPVIIHTAGTCKLEAIYISFAAGSTVSELQERVEIDGKGLSALYQRKECARHYRSHGKGEDRFKLDKDRSVVASNEIMAVNTTARIVYVPQSIAVKLFPGEHRKERFSFELDGIDSDVTWYAVDVQLKLGSSVVMPSHLLKTVGSSSNSTGAKVTIGDYSLNVLSTLLSCENILGSNGNGKVINLELQLVLQSPSVAQASSLNNEMSTIHQEVVFDLEVVGLDEKQFQAAQLLSTYHNSKQKGGLPADQSSQLIILASELIADAWASLPSRKVNIFMDFTVALPGITAVDRGSLGGLSTAEEQRLRSLLSNSPQRRLSSPSSLAISPILWMGTETIIAQTQLLIHNHTNLAAVIVAGSIEQAASATTSELEGQVMLRLPANSSKPLLLPSKSQGNRPIEIPELFWAAIENDAKVARVGRLLVSSPTSTNSHTSLTPFSLLSVTAGELSAKSLRASIGQRWRVTCSVQLVSKPLQADMVELVVLIDERYAEFYSSSNADKSNDTLGLTTSSKGYMISGKLRTILKASTYESEQTVNETMRHNITLCCLRPGFYDIFVLARPHFAEEDGGNDPAEPWWVVAEKLSVEAVLS